MESNKGRDFMFKILKKDRSKMLWLFFLEVLIGVALIIAMIVLKRYWKVMEELQEYSIFVVLAYFVLVNFVNIAAIFKYLNKTEKYLNRTDITIASIFGNEVSPVFEFGNIAILVYNEIDEVIWVSQTTLLKKDDLLGQRIYDLIPNFDDLIIEENSSEIYTQLSGKTFQLEINTLLFSYILCLLLLSLHISSLPLLPLSFDDLLSSSFSLSFSFESSLFLL